MPGGGPHDEKRILDTVLFLTWHEAYHIGAIGAIRREQGRKAIADLVRPVGLIHRRQKPLTPTVSRFIQLLKDASEEPARAPSHS